MLVETDSNEMNDVGVVELAHDERLHQKVHFGLLYDKNTHFYILRKAFSHLFSTHMCNSLVNRLGILGLRVRENCVDFIFHFAWPSEEGRKKQPPITNLHTAVSKLARK